MPLGVAIAVATQRGRGRGLELGFASGSVFVSAIPDFLLGVALVYIFGVQLQLLPVAGREGPESYILPVISLAVGAAAVLARIVRVEMLSVLGRGLRAHRPGEAAARAGGSTSATPCRTP